jgi:quinol monooxygenase YgiN
MITLVVFHNVQDYDTWKPAFDAHEDVRRSHGEVEHRVYQGADDRNRVIVHNDFDTEAAAHAFMADPSLPAVMERAGVVGEPWLGLLDRVESATYRDDAVGITVAVHHKVADYDAWKPVFDEHEAVRRAHGALGHRIWRNRADPLAVVIHNDFPSMAGVDAFRNDPSLPAVMARAGVVGEPGIGLVTLTERKVYAAATA